MYYVLQMKKSIDVHPKDMGPDLQKKIKDKLLAEEEGVTHAKHGVVVAVINVSTLGKGMIRRDGSGFATFDVEYTCLVCRPFNGEVLDCEVTSVLQMGFFASAGPVQVFVSTHLIPEDYTFDSTSGNQFTSSAPGHESLAIKVGAQVRVRIVGINLSTHELAVVGTIKADYLGVISSP